jgi:hypothetical protein
MEKAPQTFDHVRHQLPWTPSNTEKFQLSIQRLSLDSFLAFKTRSMLENKGLKVVVCCDADSVGSGFYEMESKG